MAVTIDGSTSNVIYGKGDVSLQLNPGDNYRMFTLYKDWQSQDPQPIDLSNGQKLYLVFKSLKKEIRIPEYDLINSDYSVDKVNGQVLFKISKKNSIDILAMDKRVFYIVRQYDVVDGIGENDRTSDEEILYTGVWKDESESTVESYTTRIKNLEADLEAKNKEILGLQAGNLKLMEQNAELAQEKAKLQDEKKDLQTVIGELEIKLNEYESGTEYTGNVIGGGSTYSIIAGGRLTEDFTEEQMKEMLGKLANLNQF